MNQSQEPLLNVAVQGVRVQESEYRKVGSRMGIPLKILMIGVLFLAAVIILVCLNLTQWPWNILWLDSDRVGALVVDSLQTLQYELAAIAVVSLTWLWVLTRLASYTGYFREVKTSRDTHNDWERLDNRAADPRSEKLDALKQSLLIDELDREILQQGQSEQADDLYASGVRIEALVYQRSDQSSEQLRIATDELSRVRRELVACRQQLDVSNQIKVDFVANMSYELRTPMIGIIGMADLLLSGDLSEREERFVRSIVSSSNTLLQTINESTDLTRIKSGKLILTSRHFSLRKTIEDVCNSLVASANAKQVELICYVDEATPSKVSGDPDRVRQVLHNLITNALAFTHDGEVTVRLMCKQSSKGKSVFQCDVQDTGVGLSPEKQVDLFTAFSQTAAGAVTQESTGIGMGLTICRELVGMMSGEITFRSRLGEGTRISFTMELEDVAESEAMEPSCRSLVDEHTKTGYTSVTPIARVLLVEDNPVNQSVAISMLEQLGCQVALAVDGKLAVEMGGQEKFDIVLMDCQMPNMDGYEATRLIKSDGSLNSPTPVVALTANALAGDREKCLMAGMDDYVSKPVRTQMLSHMLDKWVGTPVGNLTEIPSELASMLADVDLGIPSAETGNDGVISLPSEQFELVIESSLVDVDVGSQDDTRKPANREASKGKPIHDDAKSWKPATNDGAGAGNGSRSNSAKINLKAIDTIRGLQSVGKDDLLTKVVGVYFDKTPEIISNMEHAATVSDFESVATCAHSLKSSSAYLGAESLSKTCRLIEAALKQNNAHELEQLVAGLRSEYELVSQALSSLVEAA